MNLREGTRRLALLLGVARAIFGGFVSYLELQTTLEQRERHKKFEQLASVDIVQRQRKFLQNAPGFIPGPYPMSAKELGEKLKVRFPEYKDVEDETLALKIIAKYPQYRDMVVPWDEAKAEIKRQLPETLPPDFDQWDKAANDPSGLVAWEAGTPFNVGKNGIRSINWTSGFDIESIETVDGQTLFPKPAPEAWQYLFVVFAPILGFFIPWGAVRAIGWVGAGFVHTSG